MTSWLIEQTLLISLLLSVLLLLGPWLTKKLGPGTHYKLWLCIPISLTINTLDFSLWLDNNAATTFLVTAKSQAENLVPTENDVLGPVGILWTLGVIAMLAWVTVSHRHNTSKLQSYNHQEIDLPDATANLIDSKVRLGIGKENISPHVRGFITPELVIPVNFQQMFSTEQQALIVKHELVHLKRQDILWNLLAFTLLTLFWFNPLCWWAYRQFRVLQELSCDQTVLKGASKSIRLQYAKALLNASSHQPKLTLSYLTFGEKGMLKDRIMQIKSNVSASLFSKCAVILSILFLGASLTIANATLSATSDELTHIVKINPQYPLEAVQNDIEGYVRMTFDVNTLGRVENIRVMRSSPEGIFEEEAKRALSQWKYANLANRTVTSTVQLDFMLSPKNDTTEDAS